MTTRKRSLVQTVALVSAVLLLLMCGTVCAADFSSVVVVSIDALHPDALATSSAPQTMRMLELGSLTRRGMSTNPPKTLIAHAAMVTGKRPEDGGRQSNVWNDGEPTVTGRTIFHDAQERGYRTGFFYSKAKLGYLNNPGIDVVALAPEDAIGKAVRFLKEDGPGFAFIHVSGLDIVGPQSGWLSKAYLEEMTYIDYYLSVLYDYLKDTGDYLLIVTSDHAGYGKEHGGTTPEEARLPFGVVSDVCDFPTMDDAPYSVEELPDFLSRALMCRAR